MESHLSAPIATSKEPNTQKPTHQKRRVCLITESYYPVIGGGETQARTTAEDLVTRGFEVIVATRKTREAFKTYEEMGSIRIYRVMPHGSGHLKRWLMMPQILVLLVKHQQAFDILLVCGYRSLGIVAVIISQLFNKSCILKTDNNGEMSGEFFAGGLAKWNLSLSSWPIPTIISLRNRLFKKADAFVSISSQITRECIQSGVNPSKVHFIPNSVDTDRFHPVGEAEKLRLRQQLGLPLEGSIIIYTGRLMSVKGLPLLLEAWQEIQSDVAQRKCLNATLLLVGGGSKDIHDCEADLKAYVSTHQLASSVVFTGDVTNVDEYLKAADVFVFPPLNEAFGHIGD